MATTNSSQSISVPLPIFDGSNYDLWEKKMMTLFESQNLTDNIVGKGLTDNIVEKGLKKPTNISILEEAQQKEVTKQKDASALYLIQQSLAIKIFPRISEASTAKQAWGTLRKEFRGDSERAFEKKRGDAETKQGYVEATYGAAMEGDWKRMVTYYQEHCQEHIEYFSSPVTDTWDTVLHLAIHSKEEKPLKDLLEIMKKRELPLTTETEILKKKNKFGNTALHEATIYGNYKAVILLVERCPELLSIPNEFGETPLFTAAGFAKTEIVEYLIRHNPEQCVDDNGRLLPTHSKRSVPSGDDLSILSAAIIGQKFGLPVKRHHEVKSQVQTWCPENKRDLESGRGRNSGDPGSFSERNQRGGILKNLKVPEGCWLERIWNQKRKHVFALEFAKSLIKEDDSFKRVTKTEEEQETRAQTSQNTPVLSSLTTKKEIPLFTATRRGIEKIVELIIRLHPHAIDQRDEMNRSILDVAVMYRQEKIFDIVKEKKIPFARMRRVVDISGNTLLHHVADMIKNSGVTKPGPALQLQEELKWFERVQDVIPSYYVPLLNKDGKTAKECFEIAHEEQLNKAQIWIKETSQSCSTVAALVATVVFAAAYTVPGGSDEKGKPIFINSPYFLIFTVSDVVSLASSLTSLVVFLSLLTSPFELQEFHISLPRKLIVGFSFLFFSVLTTMLSFGATILILIQTERRLTTLLLSIASFLPVLIFGILQFRLYVSFMGSTFNILKKNWKLIHRS
ncbi:PREDICTED: ankyrin repeat-containing protein At3g12360-like isoform X3 [Populus euphratica]|uniref:Ankyrin repeat-containing protein At3g12360-like isoform X3 n=1 Tax=Populus euphratica TaxID=75702 RepID=A0AAJ6TDK2_POPEU|nr:PREDICTED: ankyrin repeat-containing protein At3g12360-like isoform X3 [Populus euphratica]